MSIKSVGEALSSLTGRGNWQSSSLIELNEEMIKTKEKIEFLQKYRDGIIEAFKKQMTIVPYKHLEIPGFQIEKEPAKMLKLFQKVYTLDLKSATKFELEIEEDKLENV